MIIVTGAYGFIGSNIVKKLNSIGHRDLILVDDMANGIKYKNLLGAQFSEYYDADEFFSRFKPWNMVRSVYHQGAISSTTETDGKKIMHYNYQFSMDLFKQCLYHQIPISYASSASVYGNNTDGKIDPLNLYAYSKHLIDQKVAENIGKFKQIHGWRYFNVYGNGEDHKGDQASPVTKFTKQAKETGKIRIFEGSDKIYRDFVAIDDVVSIVVGSMEDKFKSGIRDLGTGTVMSFETVAHMVKREHGGEIETIPFPEELKLSYQYLTRAKKTVDHRFINMTDWLRKNNK
jgi:ADP-L-glycero-D-manno-heptose 6-epimerase